MISLTIWDPPSSQNVRRMTLVTLNSAAHNKPMLIRDLMEDILPSLYKETTIKVREDLFITVAHSPNCPTTQQQNRIRFEILLKHRPWDIF